ncbi:hypothetical protein C8Q79DRAFT_933427 [Trametes meyenii]|nr:hypothetical protein C8Q79DRAFT_933427 [Trametes meyenii]
MWCTRWYLPLLLLPFPIASPFYLILWVLAISLHARPCFYCMALLTTMYISLCYWPPIPIDTPLARPWSENITTFADALRWKMPDLPPENIPGVMSMEEHCWCDVSGGVFSPVNLTMWEEASVNRVVERLQKELVIEEETERRRKCEAEVDANANGTSCAHDSSTTISRTRRRRKFPIRGVLDLLGFAPVHTSKVPSANLSDSTLAPAEPETHAAYLSNAPAPISSSEQPSAPLPLFRQEYDLRRFGFAMVLDFGWPNSQ